MNALAELSASELAKLRVSLEASHGEATMAIRRVDAKFVAELIAELQHARSQLAIARATSAPPMLPHGETAGEFATKRMLEQRGRRP